MIDGVACQHLGLQGAVAIAERFKYRVTFCELGINSLKLNVHSEKEETSCGLALHVCVYPHYLLKKTKIYKIGLKYLNNLQRKTFRIFLIKVYNMFIVFPSYLNEFKNNSNYHILNDIYVLYTLCVILNLTPTLLGRH